MKLLASLSILLTGLFLSSCTTTKVEVPAQKPGGYMHTPEFSIRVPKGQVFLKKGDEYRSFGKTRYAIQALPGVKGANRAVREAAIEAAVARGRLLLVGAGAKPARQSRITHGNPTRVSEFYRAPNGQRFFVERAFYFGPAQSYVVSAIVGPQGSQREAQRITRSLRVK